MMHVSDIYLGFYRSSLICVLLLLYLVLQAGLLRQLVLLLASYLIYWTISGKLILLIFLLSTCDFLAVRLMLSRPDLKKACLTFSLSANLSVLFFFKYFNFFISQIDGALSAAGLGGHLPTLSILAPIGLSFIVFHGISYSIEAYRGHIKTSPRFDQYLLYVSYFPKVLAGPITRPSQFFPELRELAHITLRQVTSGGELVLLGAFKKIVVASWFFKYWNELSSTATGPLAVYAAGASYGLFLLADFSGYTDIARGVSRILGLELPINFNEPYGAPSVSEFWRRWHISLSSWLRDYLYIPLGGSWHGLPRTVFNLMATMTLCGLWHGAAWTFVTWGLSHGLIMSGERIARDRVPGIKPWPVIALMLTSIALSLTWILFASPDLGAACALLSRAGELLSPVPTNVLLVAAAVIALGPIASYFHLYKRLALRMESSNAYALIGNSIMITAIVLQIWGGANVSDFVYFRF